MTRLAVTLTAVALVAGIAYALSPLFAWFIAAMAALVLITRRGLTPREKTWVLGLLGAAVAVRLLAVAGLIFATPAGVYTYPSFFGDGRYAIGRSLWIRGVWLGETLHPRFFFEAFEEYGAGGFNYVLAVLQMTLGPATWTLHLLAIALFAAAAVVWQRLAHRSYGQTAGLFVLAGLLFSPTWFAWSVTPIKEGFQLLLVGVCLTAVIAAVRRERGVRTRLLWVIVAATALAILSTLRAGGIVIVAGSVLAGLLWGMFLYRSSVALLVAASLLAVTAGALLRPSVQQRIGAEIDAAADRHIGHVKTPGTFYKLLDERFYHATGPVTLDRAEGARFLLRAAAAFFVVPLPWHVRDGSAPMLLAVQLLWYLLVVLAAAGLAGAMRRAPVLTVMLVSYVILSVVVIAPNSGNVGTLMRHRDMMIAPLLCLGGVGLSTLGGWAAARRRPALVEVHA